MILVVVPEMNPRRSVSFAVDCKDSSVQKGSLSVMLPVNALL